jgi:hypothetical protein
MPYLNRSKKRARDFTRNRKMPFTKLIYFFLSMIKESTQNALERYFLRLGADIFMSQQAFSRARQNIKWEALLELFELTVDEAYKLDIKRWNGYRVFAIDGSKIALPNDPVMRKYFGAMGAGSTSPTAQGSILYDVYNDLIADALIEPLSTDERTLAVRHIEKLRKMESFGKELILFDRGYPSQELIRVLSESGIDFVMRVRQKFNLEIDGLSMGEHRIRVDVGGGEMRSIRVIKFRLSSGESETLISSLMGGKYGVNKFKALYFKRWPVETKYDEIKKKLEVENFSGRLVDNIRQDFYAAMTIDNIATELYWEAQEDVEKERREKENKWEYQVNMNHEIGVLKDRLILTLLEDDGEKRGKMLDEIAELLQKRIIPIRPNRSLPRNIPRKARFHHNHKSNC